MKERAGIKEGASPEQLAKQRARVYKAGGLVGLLIAALGLAFNVFFTEVHEYKQLKGHLTIEVDRGSDGIIDERRDFPNLIINTGENFLVDAWQNITELEVLRYHGIGTGTAAAAEADTGLQTELTTQYNPDSTRATGTLAENASNIFESVGTNTVDASVAITEWGLFNQAATGGGVLFSRVVFGAVNLSSGDSLQTTWRLTVE